MFLCDIGNTSYHFFKNGIDFKEDTLNFNPLAIKEKIFYICVNADVHNILKHLDNWINLASYIDMQKYYDTMGIDRIVACETISDGIIVDVGSAITVDVVKSDVFEGGFIYPGLKAMGETYKNISPALSFSFNFECDLDIMPKNSQDAISYGYLKTLKSEVLSHKMDIFLTGGDAKIFAKVFPSAKVDEMLLFNGMKKIIKKAQLC